MLQSVASKASRRSGNQDHILANRTVPEIGRSCGEVRRILLDKFPQVRWRVRHLVSSAIRGVVYGRGYGASEMCDGGRREYEVRREVLRSVLVRLPYRTKNCIANPGSLQAYKSSLDVSESVVELELTYLHHCGIYRHRRGLSGATCSPQRYGRMPRCSQDPRQQGE